MYKNYIFHTFLLISIVSCGKNKTVKTLPNPISAPHTQGEILIKGDLQIIKRTIKDENIQADITDVDTKNGIYSLQVSKHSKKEVETLVSSFSQVPGIDFAEPNYLISSNELTPPKDTLWMQQWGLQNIGQDSPSGMQGEVGSHVSALAAWASSTGSRNVIVGVVDTGIDYTHPDLAANMWINQKELVGIAGVDDDGNGYADDIYGWNFVSEGREEAYYGQLGDPNPMDDNSHGTHCAGIIGAKGNNFVGVAGVNWNVSLMALKFLDKNGSGSSKDAYRAIMYGINNGVHVLSNSWGGGGKSRLVKFAIEKALEKGVLFVAAAGNDSSNNDETETFPANYDVENILSVAATDNKDQLAVFSNYGINKVHLAAPGVDIMSTIPLSKATSASKAYASFSGTSMATPFVAGAAALLISHDSGLARDPLALKERLLATADRKTFLLGRSASGGRLNLVRALENKRNEPQDNPEIITEDYDLTSPSYHTEIFDQTWAINRAGAKKLRVHFATLMADLPNYDLIAIYDKDYNAIFNFESSHPEGFYSPWVEGDTLRIRFANALVAMTKSETKEFANADEGFKAGASLCWVETVDGQEKTLCSLMTPGKPFANFESQGFVVDKVEYVLN